ncbi:Di-copper centre-containing protein [Hypoxylon cercidicola]|nr:Di-copper centre-containing protein [Hypoxylon cercidicola]
MPAAALPSWSWPRDGGQAQQPVPVTGMTTGINSGTGERPARWEVNDLQAEGGPRWDLYIQGLAALQNKTETDERSHFGVAGIHGRPYAPYNGVGSVPGSPGGGFCPHGQVLGTEIQRIASEYSGENASSYREAAQTFRLPYWDWATNAILPPACTPESITVDGPRGPLRLRNPLYSYRWPTQPLNQTQFPGSQDWPPETTRASNNTHPDFSPDAVNANLAQMADLLKDLVVSQETACGGEDETPRSFYRTFTRATTWDQMSTTANPAGVSFEASHNIIHNAVGGTFASLDLTAYDSLFMLHHANVDRLAALWVAAHRGAAHQTEPYQTGGLFGTARGATVTAASPLKPFYQADGRALHTGLTAAALDPFGYTYAELGDWERARQEPEPAPARERARREIVARVNALYGRSGDEAGGGGGEEEEWFVDVAADREELVLPCNIDVYVGESLVGRVALLAMPMRGLVRAEIPLQRAVRGLGVNTTNRGAVEEALREQLSVGIKGDGRTPIDAKNIASLQLNLAAVTVTARENEYEFPEYGERSTYVKILPAA